MLTPRVTTLTGRGIGWSHNNRVYWSLTQRVSFATTTTQRPVTLDNATRSKQASSPLNASARQSLSHLPPLSQPLGLYRNASTAADVVPENYIAYGMTLKLFEACCAQADYTIPQAEQEGVEIPTNEGGEHLGVSDSWWYKELGLQPTFSTWSQITFLHMYLLVVRIRANPLRESVQTYMRHLIDHFSHIAEHRMDSVHDIGSRSIRTKYLKDLFIQWRGIIAAYDEGLVRGDAALGAAVWRNLFKASPTGPDGKEFDWTKVAWVVAYMRRVTSELSKIDEADLAAILNNPEAPQKSLVFGYSPVDKRMAGAE